MFPIPTSEEQGGPYVPGEDRGLEHEDKTDTPEVAAEAIRRMRELLDKN